MSRLNEFCPLLPLMVYCAMFDLPSYKPCVDWWCQYIITSLQIYLMSNGMESDACCNYFSVIYTKFFRFIYSWSNYQYILANYNVTAALSKFWAKKSIYLYIFCWLFDRCFFSFFQKTTQKTTLITSTKMFGSSRINDEIQLINNISS